MRRAHTIAILAFASAVAVAAPAIAGSKGSGPSSTPPGFASGGEHKGFETFSNTSNGVTKTETVPGGWDQGKADWKAPLQSSNPVLSTRPAGLGRH